MLVHTPYLRDHHDWSKMFPAYRQVILDKLKRTAKLHDIEERIVFERHLTPQDIHDRYRVSRGAIYGLASHGKFMGAFKPGNRSRQVKNLYLAGGAAHPGPGMPMVMMSGWIAADALDADRKSRASRLREPRPATRRAAEILDARSGVAFAFFARVFERTLRAGFHAARMKGERAAGRRASASWSIYANHPSWWDGVAYVVIARRLMPGRAVYAPIDARYAQALRVHAPHGRLWRRSDEPARRRRFSFRQPQPLWRATRR